MTTVRVESADQPDLRALLEAGERYALSLYPADSCYLLNIHELLAPEVTVWAARDDDGTPLGMVALVHGTHGSAELKRLYVSQAARGRGVAVALLEALEAHARERGVTRILLETGPKQLAAIALYERHGYVHTEAFGPYIGDDFSVCMEKVLQSDSAG